ncbi:helix-turn-helix domain-containing protein [Streptomyces fulvorobeus]|nr:helix-turn-helix transcriptional regulator [Streptomyces fulvorobeus]
MVDSPTRTDLADLVRTRRQDLGLSLRKLAERCVDPEDPGEPLWKFGVLHRLEKGLPILRPSEPESRALAAGLRLPVDDVKAAAAAQFLGIVTDAPAPASTIDTVWSEDHKTRAMVRDYESMSPEDQEKVRQLMRAWSTRPASEVNGE